MNERYETLAARIDERFGEQMIRVDSTCGELGYELAKGDLIEIATALRNERACKEHFNRDDCDRASAQRGAFATVEELHRGCKEKQSTNGDRTDKFK